MRKSCYGCEYYSEGYTDYGHYNTCDLLNDEYFKPNGCPCVNEDNSINEKELKEYHKYL